MEVIEILLLKNTQKEKEYRMILINKTEKDIIHKYMPNVYISRTSKGKSSRHKYYCEESKRAMKLLGRIRRGEVT